jgi:hypothetical protein
VAGLKIAESITDGQILLRSALGRLPPISKDCTPPVAVVQRRKPGVRLAEKTGHINGIGFFIPHTIRSLLCCAEASYCSSQVRLTSHDFSPSAPARNTASLELLKINWARFSLRSSGVHAFGIRGRWFLPSNVEFASGNDNYQMEM